MNWIQKIFKPTSEDPLGVDAAVDGVKQMKAKLTAEREHLALEQAKARTAALEDPDGEVDEAPILRQRERIKIYEAALEQATAAAAVQLENRMGEIRAAIKSLESEKEKLLRNCDKEMLTTVADFIKKTGGRVVQAPTRGQGGTISIPAARALDGAEIAASLGNLPKPGNPLNGSSIALGEIDSKLGKLTLLTHYGSRKGLETLIESRG